VLGAEGFAPLSSLVVWRSLPRGSYDDGVTFRDVLADEFERRSARNARYSLRAFALALSADHAALSQILRGKRRLTTRTIRRLGATLGLPSSAIDAHCAAENDRALLDFVRSHRFRADSRWIANVLAIPVDEVNVSLQRLVRTGALVMKSRQTWEVPHA